MPKGRGALLSGTYYTQLLTRIIYFYTKYQKKHNALVFFYSTRNVLSPASILLPTIKINISLYPNYLIYFFMNLFLYSLPSSLLETII